MSMWEATESTPAEDVEAGLTRISSDHELRHRYPNAWKPATDGPRDEIRTSTNDPVPGLRVYVREPGGKRAASPRRPTGAQDRKALLAQLRKPARNERIESASGKARREFWESQASFLDYLDPARAERWRREDREAAEHDANVYAIGAEARAELEQIDEAWGDAAPWN
jgi:hypothetical protein